MGSKAFGGLNRRLKEKTAESRWFQTTGQAPFGRSKAAYWKIKGYPLLNSISSFMWMKVSFITIMVPNFHGFQMEILSNDPQGRAGVGVSFTPSWKKDCWWAHSGCLRQKNHKEMTINSSITRFSSNGSKSSCYLIFQSGVCL